MVWFLIWKVTVGERIGHLPEDLFFKADGLFHVENIRSFRRWLVDALNLKRRVQLFEPCIGILSSQRVRIGGGAVYCVTHCVCLGEWLFASTLEQSILKALVTTDHWLLLCLFEIGSTRRSAQRHTLPFECIVVTFCKSTYACQFQWLFLCAYFFALSDIATLCQIVDHVLFDFLKVPSHPDRCLPPLLLYFYMAIREVDVFVESAKCGSFAVDLYRYSFVLVCLMSIVQSLYLVD